MLLYMYLWLELHSDLSSFSLTDEDETKPGKDLCVDASIGGGMFYEDVSGDEAT